MRSNKAFYILLGLSAASAFVVPTRYTDGVRPRVSALFTPVAQPARALAGWATGRSGAAAGQNVDPRPSEVVYQENEDLRVLNARLTQEVAELRKVRAELDTLGDLRDLCTPVAVLGNDTTAARDSLALRSTGFTGLADGMFAVVRDDVVGVLIAGKAGAHVRLITDPQSRVLARFATFRPAAGPPAEGQPAGGPPAGGGFTYLGLTPRLVEGAGNGLMVCRNVPFAEVEKSGLKRGDWAVVNDQDWRRELQGRRLGVVADVRKGNRLMAEIVIKPEPDLRGLREVMVLTKEKK